MADMRTLWFKGDDDTDWRPVPMAAIDATHALEVDPEHWKAEKPIVEDGASVVEVAGNDTKQTGADGPAWYPPAADNNESDS